VDEGEVDHPLASQVVSTPRTTLPPTGRTLRPAFCTAWRTPLPEIPSASASCAVVFGPSLSASIRRSTQPGRRGREPRASSSTRAGIFFGARRGGGGLGLLLLLVVVALEVQSDVHERAQHVVGRGADDARELGVVEAAEDLDQR
jgi:hypothetical protein